GGTPAGGGALGGRLSSGAAPAGIDLTVAIAKAFRDDAAARGVRPIVVVFPMADLLDRYPGENALPLTRALRAQGLDVIDLTPPTAQEVHARGRASCFLADGHLSPDGNRLAGGWL